MCIAHRSSAAPPQRERDRTRPLRQAGVVPLIYRDLPRNEWPTVKDRFDPRIDGKDGRAFLCRSYAMGMVYRLTRWKRDGVFSKIRPFLESL